MTEQRPKTELVDISTQICELFSRAETSVPEASKELFDEWRKSCQRSRRRLEDDLLRTGVVGTIKSGKSTFINAFFRGDYLKRGAGVITSIVTRVRRSDRLRASVTFKSWHQINDEIRQALALFGTSGWRSTSEPFDLRRQTDRRDLEKAIENLESRQLLNQDTRSVGSVLLNACLKGYFGVKDYISENSEETVVFEKSEFYRHQEFAGSEDLAVFLKDLCLEIPSGELAGNIEIADCQGSDSPNPLHLAMIQDYLRTSDLIIYLVSSRTGIRQADLNFLSMIRQIGGLGNVMFVVNFDFNEHEGIDDLKRVSGKVREDLSLIVDSPAVYTFSSLYALFDSEGKSLSEKDRARLEQWHSEKEMAEFSREERKRFEYDFSRMITEQRYSLLIQNQLQRLLAAADDFRRWLLLNREIFSADEEGAGTLMERLKQQQKKTEKLRSMINSTLSGATQQLKKELKSSVDRFFDIRHGEVVPGIMDFIAGYSIAYDRYRQDVAENGFAETLFAVFQDFKEQLDRYMAETVNPRLFRFARENEEHIRDYLEQIATPHESMIREALEEFRGGESDRDNEGKDAKRVASGRPPVSTDAVKKAYSIELPDAAATLAYSRGLKTDAFMKLGFYRIMYGLRKLARREAGDSSADISALKSGVARMKRETESTIVFHFKNYRENLKFQYLFAMVDSVASEINDWLVQRFQAYSTDFARIREVTGRDRAERQKVLGDIDSVLESLGDLEARLLKLQDR